MLNPREILARALWQHVRFGSKADICAAASHVRFAPNSDRESRHPGKVMSALPSNADICSAQRHVCFGPKADIASGRNGFRPSALPTPAKLSRIGRIDRRLAFRRFQLVACSCANLTGKTNWNSDPFLPSDDAVS